MSAPLDGLRVAVFGLGEAGREIAAGLAAAGAAVRGFDPAAVPTPDGVERCDEPAASVAAVDLVCAVTASADAADALAQAFDALPPGVVYADLATSAPAAKRGLAERCEARTASLDFADVALMTTAPGRGLHIPALVCGAGAERYAAMLAPASPPIEVVDGPAGTAATRKLLRSVAIKGVAGVVIESLRAAEAAGLHDVTWQNLVEQFTLMDADFVSRLVDGTPRHAERRFHEMQAAHELLVELGIDPVMTEATIEQLDRLRNV